ncbi:MAG TPA: tetratricopeptide repeat protein [Ktedonobacteraceae bacterium]|nr:tetratricopeptide repeat protein [Ktedonobacteraceae bacterium]
MKKSTVAIPNLRLKEARELRGWSQKYVANEIGADYYYLSRWEHGTASPSPYYRQKLCELFGKDARELGLIRDKDTKVPQKTGDGLPPAISDDRTSPSIGIAIPLYDPMLPPPTGDTAKPIGRDGVLSQLREHLCEGKGEVLAAINGLPGVGKTTLAIELAHDEQVLARYKDGVLWAGLGPTPDVFATLNHWGTLLGIPAQQAAKLKSIEDWSRTLRAVIGQRQLLLVIDDAWRIEAALAFKVGGSRCAYLLTTRFPNIALHFAADKGVSIVLQELSTADGFALLARLTPEVVKNEPDSARKLVEAVGGLPLALTLMGRYLRAQSHSGQPRRIRAALERLHIAEERLRLVEPISPLERPPHLAPAAPLSLQTVLSVSDQQLEDDEKQALRALSVFPAKPNSFSEAAAIAVSAAPVEVLDALSDAGLLEVSGPGRYTLHQIVADYARTFLDDRDAFTRMADYFAEFVEQNARHFDALDQEMPNIFASLDAAYATGQDKNLVRCVNALFHFLFTRGLHAQEAGIYIERAVEAARHLNDDDALATALLNQGKVAYKQGNYAKAEQCLQEARAIASKGSDARLLSEILMVLGVLYRFRVSYELAETYLRESLDLARQTGDSKLLSDVLGNLGCVLSDKGHYADAETYNLEGLTIVRALDDRGGMAQLLINLNAIAVLRGDYEAAERYGQQALALAREIGFLDAMSAILTNLGGVALERGEYDNAESYIVEALDVARRIDDIRFVGTNVGSLGSLALKQGHYEQAEQYLRESLEIAHKIGDIWMLGMMLNEYGELQLKQGRINDAYAAFEEASNVAAGGSKEVVALTLFGLARVSAARGNMQEAQRLAAESLQMFEAMGNRIKEQVKAWLSSLSEPRNA